MDIREGLKEILSCRFADIIIEENPHGYKLVPEAIDDIVAETVYFLRSEGYVKKVEGELPGTKCWHGTTYKELEAAGYTLTEEI